MLKFLGSENLVSERGPFYGELLALLRRMDAPLRYLGRELGLRLPREALGGKDEF